MSKKELIKLDKELVKLQKHLDDRYLFCFSSTDTLIRARKIVAKEVEKK